MIGQTISHFHILARIGGGGMGTVYKAEDTRLPGRIVALKLLNPELVGNEQLKKRFLLEAQTATSLDHPNVCEIFEVDETKEGRLFMSMRYYGGATLRHRIEDAPLPALETFQVAYSIAQGLHAAHRREIIHRDIKPANIMVTEDGYVKIVDFGLAKLLGRTRVTASGVTVGTAAYMSPEQADGREVDGRTDVWSLGVVMYEMATGRLPFRGNIDQAMIYSILNENFTPVRELNPDVPEECAEVIETCLAKDRDRRYANTEDLLVAMHSTADALDWSSELSVATIAPVSWVSHRIDARRRKQRIVSGVITAAAIAIAAFLYVFFTGEDSPYVTDLRLAVMPFQSRIGPDYDALAAGLSEVISDALEEISFEKKSMWVVPGYFVPYADPPGPREAGRAFGVNRIVTGEIQRFETGKRVSVELLDAQTEKVLWASHVDFTDATIPVLTSEIVALLSGHFDEAIPRAGSETAAMNPAPAKAYIEGRGALHPDPSTAAPLLRQAVRDSPDVGIARSHLGWATLRAGSDGSPVDLLREGRALSPGDHRTHFFLAEYFRVAGEPDSAEFCFKEAISRAPRAYLTQRGLARVYRDQGRLDEAEEWLHASADDRRDFFSDYRDLGLFYYRLANYDSATHWLERAVVLAPDDANSLTALGSSYHNLGDARRAATMFERSFRLSPNCDTCNNVGLAHFMSGRYREASDYYEIAFTYCDSTDFLTWGNWALALFWVDGAEDQARSAGRRAIALAQKRLQADPDDVQVLGGLVDYVSMFGTREETRGVVEEALPYARNNPDLMYRIGTAYEMMGERNTALEYIGNAIRHQYPVEIISRTPQLRDLTVDPRFVQMVASMEQEKPQG